MTKCIYCGFCQEACPVDAIVEVSSFTFVVSSAQGHIGKEFEHDVHYDFFFSFFSLMSRYISPNFFDHSHYCLQLLNSTFKTEPVFLWEFVKNCSIFCHLFDHFIILSSQNILSFWERSYFWWLLESSMQFFFTRTGVRW